MGKLKEEFYGLLREQAHEKFWHNFDNEPQIHFPGVNIESVRRIAEKLITEYVRFMELRCRLYEEENPNEREITAIEYSTQAPMAFAFFLLSQNEGLAFTATTGKGLYQYFAKDTECMNLGQHTAEFIFGKLIKCAIAATKEAYGTDSYIKVDPAIMSYKDRKPRKSLLVNFDFRFGKDAEITH